MSNKNFNNLKGDETSGNTSLNFEFYPEEGVTKDYQMKEKTKEQIGGFQSRRIKFGVIEALMNA